MHPNALRMAQVIAEFNNGRAEAVGEVFAEDVVWHAAGDNPYSGDRVGKESAAHWFLQMRELCEFVVEPVDLMGDDRYVVFLLHLQGSRPDGRTLDQKQMNAWRFEDGLCVEGWFLPDSTADWDAFSR